MTYPSEKDRLAQLRADLAAQHDRSIARLVQRDKTEAATALRRQRQREREQARQQPPAE